MSGKKGRKVRAFLEAGMAQDARKYGLRNAGKGFLFHIFTLAEEPQYKKFYSSFRLSSVLVGKLPSWNLPWNGMTCTCEWIYHVDFILLAVEHGAWGVGAPGRLKCIGRKVTYNTHYLSYFNTFPIADPVRRKRKQKSLKLCGLGFSPHQPPQECNLRKICASKSYLNVFNFFKTLVFPENTKLPVSLPLWLSKSWALRGHPCLTNMWPEEIQWCELWKRCYRGNLVWLQQAISLTGTKGTPVPARPIRLWF